MKDIPWLFLEGLPIQRQYSRRRVAKTLGVGEYNKKRRCGWCRERLMWTVNLRSRNIVLSDEMTIIFKSDGKIYVWRKSEGKVA